jgi:hypothetical protein
MFRVRSLSLCFVAVWCLTTQSLFAQEFREEFHALDGSKWQIHLPLPHSGVEIRPCLNAEEKATGEVMLRNGAFLFRQYAPKNGSLVSTEFTWEDNEGGQPYTDDFQLLLRTTGEVAGALKPEPGRRSYEITSGLIVRVNAGYGKVSLDYVVDGKAEVLTSKYVRVREDKVEKFDQEPTDGNAKEFALPEGAGVNWYKLTADDDGKTISIYINGTLVLTSDYDATHLPGTMLGIGNRRSTGGFPMVSYVKWVSARPIR